jgi:hypothetical protein
MPRTTKTIIILLAFALLLVPAAYGQRTTGTISGTVKDATGAIVPGAEVTATNQDTGVVRSTITNDAGFYSLPNLLIGTYNVSATMSGFKKTEIKDVKLDVSQDRVVDFSLTIGQITDIVEVTSAPPLVELRSGEVSNLIQEKQMTELPLNGRSFVQLTLLVPGASVQNGANTRNTGLLSGVDISMNGNASTANMWLVGLTTWTAVPTGPSWSILPSTRLRSSASPATALALTRELERVRTSTS